jgi:drug/metabolite transporter (DMT)-like permease
MREAVDTFWRRHPVREDPGMSTGGARPRTFNIWLALSLAIPFGSTAVLFIKASALPPIWLAAGRLLISSAVLMPLAMRDARRDGGALGWSALKPGLLPGLMLALHFTAWIVGARMTSAAEATLIGNLLPVAMPFVVFVMLRELPSRREATSGVIGIAGVVAMGVGSLGMAGHLRGDIWCAVSVILVAVYLVLARQLRRGSLWLYLAPLYGIGGVICTVIALAVDGVPPLPMGREALYLIGLALFPTVIAHSIYNRAMSEVRPNTVGIMNLMQCPLAGLAAWALWSERPSPGFWVASAATAVAMGVLAWPAFAARWAPSAIERSAA